MSRASILASMTLGPSCAMACSIARCELLLVRAAKPGGAESPPPARATTCGRASRRVAANCRCRCFTSIRLSASSAKTITMMWRRSRTAVASSPAHMSSPPSPVSATTGRSRSSERRADCRRQRESHRRQAVRDQHLIRVRTPASRSWPETCARRHRPSRAPIAASRAGCDVDDLERREVPSRAGERIAPLPIDAARDQRRRPIPTSRASPRRRATAAAISPTDCAANGTCRSSIADAAKDTIGAANVHGRGISSTGSRPTAISRSACSMSGRSIARVREHAAEPRVIVRNDTFGFVGDHCGHPTASQRRRIATASASPARAEADEQQRPARSSQ